MSNHLSRLYGLKLERLPSYENKFNEAASQCEGAKHFRIRMCNLAIQQAGKRVNGDTASLKTIEASKDALGGMATTLWGLGFQLATPEGISEKHVRAIVRHKWAFGISVGALSVLMTQLGKLAIWIKKPGMVKAQYVYLPEVEASVFKRKKVATHSKSVSGNGYDLETIINKADSLDLRFGIMVRMAIAFGLRRCELLQIKPHLDDKGLYFDVRKGVAKNGRHRAIPVEIEVQRHTLDYAKSMLPKMEHLGWTDKPNADGELLERNEGRYNDLMQQLGLTKKLAGITGHGLRAQYSEDIAISKGFVPATMGGTSGQLDKESLDLARLQVSENLGHSRITVTGAYYGTLKPKIPNSLGQRLGSIQLDQRKLATIFINPPLIAQPSGEFAKLPTRKLESCDITAVIEDMSDGIGLEIATVDVKTAVIDSEFNHKSLTLDDREHLKRLSTHLLLRFGVDLAGYSMFKVAQATPLTRNPSGKLESTPDISGV